MSHVTVLFVCMVVYDCVGGWRVGEGEWVGGGVVGDRVRGTE